MDEKLEVVTMPVSDVDRAREFYQRLGWRLDDTPPGVVQLTPPGSGCSVQFGQNRTSAAPGSAANTYLIVSDVEAARAELVAAGVEVSEVFHPGKGGRESGPDPDHPSYLSFASFNDPDGNGWLFQKSRPGSLGASTLPQRRSALRGTWQRRCAVRRSPTVSTRSASAEQMRIGPTGTPHTWSRSRPGRSCRHERPRRDHSGFCPAWTGTGRTDRGPDRW